MSRATTPAQTTTAGIDTAKDKLDFAVHKRNGCTTYDNTPAGWDALAHAAAQAGVTRVGIEATGGYERGITRHLQNASITVIVLQPLQVRAFAALRLQRAKSDRIDAALIADCTHTIDATAKLPPDPRFDALADHLTYIDQITDDIVRLKTRIEHATEPRIRRMAKADIDRLERRKKAEIARLTEALRRHDDLHRRYELVLSIPAIGQITALTLVIRMPELGQISREQAASLAGLAPFVRQSGAAKGQAHIGGGRTRLRRALYAAAWPGATRWNKALVDLYGRLTAHGKTRTAALVACARKLLVFANAVVARGTAWQTRSTPA